MVLLNIAYGVVPLPAPVLALALRSWEEHVVP